jgi:hypothetical protein
VTNCSIQNAFVRKECFLNKISQGFRRERLIRKESQGEHKESSRSPLPWAQGELPFTSAFVPGLSCPGRGAVEVLIASFPSSHYLPALSCCPGKSDAIWSLRKHFSWVCSVGLWLQLLRGWRKENWGSGPGQAKLLRDPVSKQKQTKPNAIQTCDMVQAVDYLPSKPDALS